MKEDPKGNDLSDLFSTTLGSGSARGSRAATTGPGRDTRRTPGRATIAALGVLVALTSLLPLYGDPRATPLTHPLWARMLLRGLEMTDAVRVSGQASQVFSVLSWRESLALSGDSYTRSDGIVAGDRGEVTATDGVGELSYSLAVVRGGDYRLRVRISGDPAAPATAELAHLGGASLQSFTIPPGPGPSWVTAGTTHLDRGAYSASVWLPAGASLEYVEVAPPCLNPIEPPGGWRTQAVTSSEDVAITVLKAIDREDELPPADLPLERTGADFQVEGPDAPEPPSLSELEERWLRAGDKGLRAVIYVDVPEPGLYTISAFGLTGDGQSWLADGCRKAVACPEREAAPRWRTVMTQQLQAGRHYFAVTLASGAAIERLRLERKKDAPGDYVGTLEALGFDPGPAGPISRDRALEAVRFVQRQTAMAAEVCGDVRLPEAPRIDVAALPGGAAAGATAETAGPQGGGPVEGGIPAGPPPLGVPQLPPQQPSSPVLPQG